VSFDCEGEVHNDDDVPRKSLAKKAKTVGRSFDSGSGTSQRSIASQVSMPTGPVPPVVSLRLVDIQPASNKADGKKGGVSGYLGKKPRELPEINRRG